MKRFLPVLLMGTGIFASCSTNSNSTTSTNSAPAVKKSSTAATASTANKPGIRSMQKFKRTPGMVTGPVRIVIDKSDFELRVYDSKGLLAAYPVVFGLKPLEDKFMQGDRKTPEGNFKIVYTKQHQLWRKMFMLDYPTKESISRFNNRKSNGQIPSNASVGNGIGIHGVEKGNDYFIDRYYNWTNGCISLKNTHIDDLALYVKTGTAVYIQK